MMSSPAPLLAAVAACLAMLVAPDQGELVIVKEGTGLYHRPGCPVVRDGRRVVAMTLGQAASRGFKPHPACDPSMAAPSKPAVPAAVMVDDNGKYYHRERCPKLGPHPRKIDLAAAAKKYWPCPRCRPPLRPRK